MQRCRIAVLVSGNGTNLQAIMGEIDCGRIHGEIVAVVSNKPDAFALLRAKKKHIPTLIVNGKEYQDRASYDDALTEALEIYKPDMLVLAGFMRILTAGFVNRFKGKMLNIHPSLLPKYQGLNTHQRAIEAGDSEHGATVHFVTEELDGGPVILQAKVPVFEDDNADLLAQRVHEQEHRIYPLVISWFCAGRLAMQNGLAILDGKPLSANGYAND